MTDSFFKHYMKFRAVAVAAAVLALIFGVVKLQAHPIDVDIHVAERIILEREVHENQGREAWERINDSTCDHFNDRDVERGTAWARDNMG